MDNYEAKKIRGYHNAHHVQTCGQALCCEAKGFLEGYAAHEEMAKVLVNTLNILVGMRDDRGNVPIKFRRIVKFCNSALKSYQSDGDNQEDK